ncbi:sugar nucleotide-binding protein [Streptomyces sp. RS10V-4]|uniref:sugar nucleotide-binding protein n=1 Tax=Streptomyces rhizoryzae TaxID=2932493 RepID=UPI0020065631|nr:sugar nucleotide-binding protein [Streptomyces rhizoryzae]MCK7622587.1 sugar nucleotide-binding protein [Streptomyces rhizoryzae]
MTVLVIGGSGYLGAELVRRAAAAGHGTVATFATRPGTAPAAAWHHLDVRDPARITGLLCEVAPSVVLNAAAAGADRAVIAEGAVRVAQAAARQGCRLVHVSSDAVFAGGRPHYDESCLPDPVTPYGAAKAAAEAGVRLVAPDAVVARTSLIIGDGRSVHERLVHELAAGRREGALFTDEVRCPVHVADLAGALLELALSQERGTWHLAGADALSRYDLGVLVARRDGFDPALLPSGRRADSRLPGALDVRLDSGAARARLRAPLRGAREFLAAGPPRPLT